MKLPPNVTKERSPPELPPGAAPTRNPGLGFSSHLSANGVLPSFWPSRVSNPLAPLYASSSSAAGGASSSEVGGGGGGERPTESGRASAPTATSSSAAGGGAGGANLSAFGPEYRPPPFRRDPLDVSDIPGTRPSLFHRARANPRYGPLDFTSGYLDYSDVEQSRPAAAIRPAHNRAVEQIDVGRLSMWSAMGDSGRLVRSRRAELNPLEPHYTYNVSAEAQWRADREAKAAALAAQRVGQEGRTLLEGPPTGELVLRIHALAHPGHGGTSPPRPVRYHRAAGVSNLWATVAADRKGSQAIALDRSRTSGFLQLHPTITHGRKDLPR